MLEEKKQKKSKCYMCENYNKKENKCNEYEYENCNKADFSKCDKYTIKHNLYNF